MSANVNLFCFLASYSLAWVLEILRVWRQFPALKIGVFVLTSAGWLAHTIYLTVRSGKNDLPPLIGTTHDWMLVLAWLLVTAILAIAIRGLLNNQQYSLSLFGLPLVTLLVLASSQVNDIPKHFLESQNFLKMLHASSLVIGIGCVVIGLLLSLMYLWQHRRLKFRKKMISEISLPSLTSLERFNRWAVIATFPFLTLGFLSGLLLMSKSTAESSGITFQDPVVIGFSLLWIALTVLLAWLIKNQSTGGRQVAMLTAWSFGFLIFTILSLQMLVNLTDVPSHHGRSIPPILSEEQGGMLG